MSSSSKWVLLLKNAAMGNLLCLVKMCHMASDLYKKKLIIDGKFLNRYDIDENLKLKTLLKTLDPRV